MRLILFVFAVIASLFIGAASMVLFLMWHTDKTVAELFDL